MTETEPDTGTDDTDTGGVSDRVRGIKEAQIRSVIADQGKDPDRYEVIWTDEELSDYHLRRLDRDEMRHRYREELAGTGEFLVKALRHELGYDRAEIREMDVHEMAEAFRDELAARTDEDDEEAAD